MPVLLWRADASKYYSIKTPGDVVKVSLGCVAEISTLALARSVFSRNTNLSSQSGPLASQLTELTAATVTRVICLTLCTSRYFTYLF